MVEAVEARHDAPPSFFFEEAFFEAVFFDEVFLDDVAISDGDRLGEVGAGWEVARTTLRSERSSP